MGVIWWIYGIGLKGTDPTWQAVPGRTVLQDPGALVEAEVLDDPVEAARRRELRRGAAAVAQAFDDEGWEPLDPSRTEFGQAGAAAGDVPRGGRAPSTPASSRSIDVFDIGGERYPNDRRVLDLFAFFHEPPTSSSRSPRSMPHRTEPGRAPGRRRDRRRRASPSTCTWSATSAPGDSRRRCSPSVGSIIFFALCWLLHRRDRFVDRQPISAPAAG